MTGTTILTGEDAKAASADLAAFEAAIQREATAAGAKSTEGLSWPIDGEPRSIEDVD